MRRGGDQEIPVPTARQPGRPPPWAELPTPRGPLTLDGIREAMATAPPARLVPSEGTAARPSAVLAALYEADEPTSPSGRELRVLLTRRAQHMRSHRGEVSFPGGAQEPGEDALSAAKREAWEEVALDPGRVEVLGQLDHLETFMSRSYIVPFVGVLPGGSPELVANPAEVERILHVPVSELLLPDVYREERWGVPPMDRPMHFFELVGDTIWGATARMLVNLLSIVTGARWEGYR